MKRDFDHKFSDEAQQRDVPTDMISLNKSGVITLCLDDQHGGERSEPGVPTSERMLQQLHTTL